MRQLRPLATVLRHSPARYNQIDEYFQRYVLYVLRNEYSRNVDPVIHNTVSIINSVCLIIV